MHLILIFLSTLAFATENNNNKPVAPPANAQASTKSVAAAAITQLENKGVIPKLDHSAGLKGPDTDNNGIRDDIDAFLLSKKWPAPKLKAAQQHARVFQDQITVDLSNKAAVKAIELRADKSINCIFSVFERESYLVSEQLEQFTANTKERSKAYLTYDKAQDGTTSSIPDGNTCE